MELLIAYHSKWGNSFLSGSNNEPLPKKGRDFCASMKEMRKYEEKYIRRDITKDTVMGILCRLIGDPRKLYQARKEEFGPYLFKEFESLISFEKETSVLSENQSVVLRNIKAKFDQNGFIGTINDRHPHFVSDYSKKFWSILALDIEQLLTWIISGDQSIVKEVEVSPLDVISNFNRISNIEHDEKTDQLDKAIAILSSFFDGTDYYKKEKINPLAIYSSSLYLQYERLKDKYDLENLLTDRGVLKGISKRGFTSKNFMELYASGQKRIWTTPYVQTTYIKGEGKVTKALNVEDGIIRVMIKVSNEVGEKISEMIENAGVHTFPVGKKGLGYLLQISSGEQ